MTELATPSLSAPGALHTQYPMAHEEVKEINVQGRTVTSSAENQRQFGLAVPSVAEVQAGQQRFTVLDTSNSNTYGTPLLLVDESFHDRYDRAYKGIRTQIPIVVGRNSLTERFDYHPTVSGKHFSIAFDGINLAIKNLRPRNRTLLTGDFVEEATGTSRELLDNIVADYTAELQSEAEMKEVDPRAPYGYYQSLPIIGRGIPSVRGGVYYTKTPMSEAVVVDNHSAVMLDVEDKFLREIAPLRQSPSQGVLEYLKAVNTFTQKILPYNMRAAARLSEPHYDTNGLVNLSEYIKMGAGVCRHQCLLAADLLESLTDRRIIYGQSRVERNRDIDAHGAHAWTMFTTASGKDIVIDPAQNFVGTKPQARQEKRWKYELPLEQ